MIVTQDSKAGEFGKQERIYEGDVDIKKLPQIQEAMKNCLEDGMVGQEDCDRLFVAVDELYSNICIHSGAGSAQILCSLSDTRVKVVFMDDGVPFDPLGQADPDVTLSAGEREIGGLGIYMVKRMMDVMSYEYVDGRNCLTVIMDKKKIFPEK